MKEKNTRKPRVADGKQILSEAMREANRHSLIGVSKHEEKRRFRARGWDPKHPVYQGGHAYTTLKKDKGVLKQFIAWVMENGYRPRHWWDCKRYIRDYEMYLVKKNMNHL